MRVAFFARVQTGGSLDVQPIHLHMKHVDAILLNKVQISPNLVAIVMRF
jgi:hypothetical protein